MGAGFTPGPWELTSMNSQTLVHVGSERLARVFTRSGHANARLIAAAPELYEALDKCRAIIKFHVPPGKCVSTGNDVLSAREAFEAAVTALAKARGDQ